MICLESSKSSEFAKKNFNKLVKISSLCLFYNVLTIIQLTFKNREIAKIRC